MTTLDTALLPPLSGPIAQTLARVEAQPPPVEPEDPKRFVPMKETNLKLTEEQEKALVDHALGRMAHIRFEMGLQPDGTVQQDSWLDLRMRNEQTNANDLKWRHALGGVFRDSNITLGNSKRQCRLYAARLRDDLLGTRPFFGAFAQDGANPDDVQLAKDAESDTQKRIEESNIPATIREAYRLAAIRNEAVLKVTYSRDATQFIGPATVYVDNNGRPIFTEDRNLLIFEDDDFLPDPHTEGLLRLEKDPSFSMVDGQFDVQYFPDLEQTLIHYDNVRGLVLEPRDFLCPLTAEDVHSADLVAHLREDTIGALNAAFGGFATFHSYKDSRPVTGRLQPRDHQNEQFETLRPYAVPTILVAEVYLRFDADGDGLEEEILLVLDVREQKAIFYDYLGNHMSRRPFTVYYGVEREPNRWYGVGVFQMMSHNSLYIDTQLNRFNRSDSESGSIRWVNKNAAKEWRDGNPIAIGSGNPVVIDQTWDTNQPIAGVINMNELQEGSKGWDLMQKMEIAGEMQFGVMGSAEASGTNLNSSRTATGIMNIERNAGVLIKDSEVDHIRSTEDTLSLAVEFLLENRPKVSYTLTDDRLVTLNRDEIRGLTRKVKLLLTRSKSAEALVTNEKAEAIALRYFRLTPREQNKLRPLYINQLRSLEVPDADQMLPEVTNEEVAAWQQAEAAKAAPPEPPSQSISVKFDDLARSEQIQLLKNMGITPASDEEIAAEEAMEQAQELAKAEAKSQSAPKPNGSANSPSRR